MIHSNDSKNLWDTVLWMGTVGYFHLVKDDGIMFTELYDLYVLDLNHHQKAPITKTEFARKLHYVYNVQLGMLKISRIKGKTHYQLNIQYVACRDAIVILFTLFYKIRPGSESLLSIDWFVANYKQCLEKDYDISMAFVYLSLLLQKPTYLLREGNYNLIESEMHKIRERFTEELKIPTSQDLIPFKEEDIFKFNKKEVAYV